MFASWMVAVGLALCAPRARADESSFRQGTWTVAAYGGWIGDGDNTILNGHAAIGFHLLDGFAITGEAGLYEIRRDGERGAAGSGDLLFRWYVVQWDWLSVFLDLGCGVMAGGIDLPAQTSSWNFTPQARIGVALEFVPRAHFTFQAGWWHASTASFELPNPGFNGAQLAVGVMIEP